MAYFINIFTVETWAAAGTRNYSVSGFQRPTSSRGGYYQSTFDAVSVGDVLVCYVKAPAKRWVGALRVESPMFIDEDDALWGHDENGNVRFPARFRTAPMTVVPVELGVPVEETIEPLRSFDERTWGGLFRRSLVRLPDHDGETLLELLRQTRDPSPVRLPRRRVQPAHVVSPSPADEHRPSDDVRPPTVHAELVWKLIQLGKTLRCDVWLAPDERGKSFDGAAFADHALDEFPSLGLDPESIVLVRTIDVLWVRGRAVVAAFEVEATTSIYSGLLRMSDLVAFQPNTTIDLFIVAPDERAAKVRAEIIRPTFESFDPPLRGRCRYLSASSLDACLERTRPPLNRYLKPTVIKEFAEVVDSSAALRPERV